MMRRLAIGGTALAGSPADFGDDDIGVMQDGLVQERDHFEIRAMSPLRGKADVTSEV